jgi:hypothetical protein
MYASRAAGAAVLLMMHASLAQAQVGRAMHDREQRIELSIFGGGTAYTDFHRTVLSSAAGPPGSPGVPGSGSGTRTRRLTAETAPSLGVGVGYWVNPHWGIRLHGAVAPSRFHVISGSARTDPRLEAAADSTVMAPLRIWTADAAILFRLPFELAGVVPYGVIGAGMLEYRTRAGEGAHVPPEAAGGIGNGSHSQPVGLLGGGAAVPLAWRRTLLSFELSTHIGRPATRAADGAAAGAGEGSGAGSFREGMEDPPLTSQVRLLVGLTIPLFANRVQVGSPAPPGPAAPPSPGPPTTPTPPLQ